MTALIVLDCGPMTSPQDGGRVGRARDGLSRSGAMDRDALARANTLVGNPPDAAAIELMLLGGRFTAEGGAVDIAIAGAAMPVTIDGVVHRPSTVARLIPGETLAIGAAATGVFAYLAIAGGLGIAPMAGSVSLQARAGIGGLGGRALRAGDRVPLAPSATPLVPGASLDVLASPDDGPIRAVLGPQDDHFAPGAIAAFLAAEYTVSEEADRMGYRLAGPAIRHRDGYNIVSDGIVAGSIQVPGSGVPIVMMADHQTTGGYPKIATVISVDLGRLAQRRPGSRVRFAAVPLVEAHRLLRERQAWLAALPQRVRRPESLPDTEALLALNLAGAAVDALEEPPSFAEVGAPSL